MKDTFAAIVHGANLVHQHRCMICSRLLNAYSRSEADSLGKFVCPDHRQHANQSTTTNWVGCAELQEKTS